MSSDLVFMEKLQLLSRDIIQSDSAAFGACLTALLRRSDGSVNTSASPAAIARVLDGAIPHFMVRVQIPKNRIGSLVLSNRDLNCDLDIQSALVSGAPIFRVGIVRAVLHIPAAQQQTPTGGWPLNEEICFIVDFADVLETVKLKFISDEKVTPEEHKIFCFAAGRLAKSFVAGSWLHHQPPSTSIPSAPVVNSIPQSAAPQQQTPEHFLSVEEILRKIQQLEQWRKRGPAEAPQQTSTLSTTRGVLAQHEATTSISQRNNTSDHYDEEMENLREQQQQLLVHMQRRDQEASLTLQRMREEKHKILQRVAELDAQLNEKANDLRRKMCLEDEAKKTIVQLLRENQQLKTSQEKLRTICSLTIRRLNLHPESGENEVLGALERALPRHENKQ